MVKIIYDSAKHDYNPIIKTFFISEKDVKFATTYELVNPKTKQSMVFDFTHATGPEFDPNTRWVYKTKDGELTLWVGNDAEVTKARGDAYKKAKMKNMKIGGNTKQFTYNIGGL